MLRRLAHATGAADVGSGNRSHPWRGVLHASRTTSFSIIPLERLVKFHLLATPRRCRSSGARCILMSRVCREVTVSPILGGEAPSLLHASIRFLPLAYGLCDEP